jgi:predicted dehydrogenase
MCRYNIHHPENVTRRSSMQGVIRQIFTHHAYVAIYLVGQPAEVSAFQATINDGTVAKENLALVNMRMASGALVHMQANFGADDHSSDPWSFYVKVIGTKGAARYSYNDWVVNQKHVVHSHTYVPYPHTIHAEDRHFIEQVLGHGSPPLSSIDDAITALHIIEAVELSIKESRAVALPAQPLKPVSAKL